MRIIHTSDWHLGQYFFTKTRAQEHQQFLDWLLAQIKHYQVDALIVAGDIFDTGSPQVMPESFITALLLLSEIHNASSSF